MNRLKIIGVVSLGLLDLIAGLFAWWSFVSGETIDNPTARSAPIVVPSALSSAPTLAGGDEHETLARPLFAKSRRPWQGGPAALTEAKASPPPAGLKLHAIVGVGHSVRAFVTSNASVDGKWLRLGETFENWTVASITAEEVGLRLNADQLQVGLDYDKAAAGAPIPALAIPARATKRDDAPEAKAPAPDAFMSPRGAQRVGH